MKKTNLFKKLIPGSVPAGEVNLPTTLPVDLLYRQIRPLVQEDINTRSREGSRTKEESKQNQVGIPETVEKADHDQAAERT